MNSSEKICFKNVRTFKNSKDPWDEIDAESQIDIILESLPDSFNQLNSIVV